MSFLPAEQKGPTPAWALVKQIKPLQSQGELPPGPVKTAKPAQGRFGQPATAAGAKVPRQSGKGDRALRLQGVDKLQLRNRLSNRAIDQRNLAALMGHRRRIDIWYIAGKGIRC